MISLNQIQMIYYCFFISFSTFNLLPETSFTFRNQLKQTVFKICPQQKCIIVGYQNGEIIISDFDGNQICSLKLISQFTVQLSIIQIQWELIDSNPIVMDSQYRIYNISQQNCEIINRINYSPPESVQPLAIGQQIISIQLSYIYYEIPDSTIHQFLAIGFQSLIVEYSLDTISNQTEINQVQLNNEGIENITVKNLLFKNTKLYTLAQPQYAKPQSQRIYFTSFIYTDNSTQIIATLNCPYVKLFNTTTESQGVSKFNEYQTLLTEKPITMIDYLFWDSSQYIYLLEQYQLFDGKYLNKLKRVQPKLNIVEINISTSYQQFSKISAIALCPRSKQIIFSHINTLNIAMFSFSGYHQEYLTSYFALPNSDQFISLLDCSDSYLVAISSDGNIIIYIKKQFDYSIIGMLAGILGGIIGIVIIGILVYRLRKRWLQQENQNQTNKVKYKPRQKNKIQKSQLFTSEDLSKNNNQSFSFSLAK